ncbi:MAG TPA: hypothetical protein PK402_12660 [Tepidisphaeraceae bacterium]|nr:hypothetical protein [Tepidisphaeraceae bacterium]
MRAAFGLIGILATLGVLILILAGPGGYLSYTKTTLDAGKKANAEVNVIGGNAPDGTIRAIDTIAFKLERNQSGKLRGLLVTQLVVGGAMEQRYALEVNDLITDFGPNPVDFLVQGRDDAEAFLSDAYQRGTPLIIIRNDESLTLNATETNSMSGVANPVRPIQPGATVTTQPSE